jgi:hypothetical protein
MLTYIHVSSSSARDSSRTNGILGFVGLQHAYYLDFQVSKVVLVAVDILHMFCPYLLGSSVVEVEA